MIKKITFKNFFSFRDTEIDLTQENVLIGINGSGKTNFLKALALLKPLVNSKLKDTVLNEWGGFNEIFFKGEPQGRDISIEYMIDGRILGNGLPETVSYLAVIPSEHLPTNIEKLI